MSVSKQLSDIDFVTARDNYQEIYEIYLTKIKEDINVAMSEVIAPQVIAEFDLDLKTIDTFKILAFGSGNGEKDIAFLKVFLKEFPCLKIEYTAVDMNESFIKLFQSNVKANKSWLEKVDFKWLNTTCEDFLKDHKSLGQKFHFIQFLHVLYYVDKADVLDSCMSKLLAPGGLLVSAVLSEASIFNTNYKMFHGKFSWAWNNFTIVTNKHVEAIAQEKGWKHKTIVRQRKIDITDTFVPQSEHGSIVLNFLFHAENAVSQLKENEMDEVLRFLRTQVSEENFHGELKQMAPSDPAIVIFSKGNDD